MKVFISKMAKGLKTPLGLPKASIRMTITMAFTLIAGVGMVLLGIILYGQFTLRTREIVVEHTGKFLGQTKRGMEDYLRSMRRISDALYYSSIKNMDLETDSLDPDFSLLYEANKDDLISIALYTQEGGLVSAVPVSGQRAGAAVRDQDWFTEALGTVENLHFSLPHVQHLFDEVVGQYHWVISISRAVELTRRGQPERGVLLVDMNYSGICQILEKANSGSLDQYIYLCSSEGDIIYHPRMTLINAGLYSEENESIAGRSDGSYTGTFQGHGRITVIKTVSYTGWKLVSVVPLEGYAIGMGRAQYFLILILAFSLLGLLVINRMVSGSVTRPLYRLDESVKDLENGNLNPIIYVGGSEEVERLGRTLQTSVHKINELMADVFARQEEKRRSELDALQSQINPHFLYNTLDSVVWMIEGGHDEGAVYMIHQLANLLRISISQGRTILPIRDELRHAQSYMNIQKIRYKNDFEVRFDVPEALLDLCTVKLILQPILENAIYYGVQGMDGDGDILVTGRRTETEVFLDVVDNGLGMPEERVAGLLTGTPREEDGAGRHGNGVGLKNVHTRIQLWFGPPYGLEIASELDEGTRVRIHLPAIPYSRGAEDMMMGRKEARREEN